PPRGHRRRPRPGRPRLAVDGLRPREAGLPRLPDGHLRREGTLSLLLRHFEAKGPLGPADLEAATRRQQLVGGSLDTAILELGLLAPRALDASLQAACGLPGAPLRLIERGPIRPWGLIP